MPVKKLTTREWRPLMERHQIEVAEVLDHYLEQKRHGFYHPGLEFLFSYFSFRPSKIRRWSPGINQSLELSKDHPFLNDPRFVENLGYSQITSTTFPRHRKKAIEWTYDLLLQTKKRQALFSCFCVHEWAMLYKEAEKRRHPKVNLRLSSEEIDQFVEASTTQCTHYDALRFYTEKAKPRSNQQLTRETQADFEQPACLHANMDLYKWAYKVYPWCSSDLLFRCFKLALKCREIDMRSTPYDMLPFGGEPIKVETAEGRTEFVQHQQILKKEAEPLRDELIELYRELLEPQNIASH